MFLMTVKLSACGANEADINWAGRRLLPPKDATVKKSVDYLAHVGAEEPVLLYEALIIDLFQFLKLVFNTLIIGRILRFAGLINRRCVEHWLVPYDTVGVSARQLLL